MNCIDDALESDKHSFSRSSTSLRDRLEGWWLIRGQDKLRAEIAMLSADLDRTKGGLPSGNTQN